MQLKTTNKPELIVAVISQAFDDIFQQEGFIKSEDSELPAIIDQLQPFSIIGSRNYLEDAPTYRQYLPYIVFSKMVGDVKKYFVYQRTKKIGEERLAGNISVGLGGHVETKDINIDNATGAMNVLETLRMNSSREIAEEIFFCYDTNNYEKTPIFQGFIKDNSNSVGTVHLGVLFEVFLQDEAVQINCIEEELKTVGFMSLEEIQDYCKDNSVESENWTTLYLNDQKARSQAGTLEFVQMPRTEPAL